ncbi:MAG: acetyl-CoA C-acyltransferase [Gammaproteobacteria bacterium]|nr:acetyl-CoA C-acyltransferase [Gammaproteobacteria bacterium]
MNAPTVPRVAVIGGVRTPFARAGAQLRRWSALELSVHAVNALLARLELEPAAVEELAFGNVVLDPRTPHLAREVVFGSRLPAAVRALTLVDNCITGTSAIEHVAAGIRAGRIEVGIAGGVESMSNPAVLFTRRAGGIFVDLARARGLRARLGAALRLRPRDFLPAPPAIAEPSTGLSMGEHCELMVKTWGIGREAQDLLAWRSHRHAWAATEDGRLPAEIAPIDDIDRDPLIRADSSMEQLARLPTVFDRSPAGTITAGNSSPLTDGAAALVLMSESAAAREGREPLAFLGDAVNASIDPADGLLMGPGLAVPRLLARTALALDDVDVVEMHEAFAGQVLCNLAAWERGWKEPAIGRVSPDRLNPLGSSIAVGHPFAATGIRILTTLANELARRGARRGLVSICGAGATAVAMLLERDGEAA